ERQGEAAPIRRCEEGTDRCRPSTGEGSFNRDIPFWTRLWQPGFPWRQGSRRQGEIETKPQPIAPGAVDVHRSQVDARQVACLIASEAFRERCLECGRAEGSMDRAFEPRARIVSTEPDI